MFKVDLLRVSVIKCSAGAFVIVKLNLSTKSNILIFGIQIFKLS